MKFNVINVVDKPWGRELHFAIEEQYVGKILEVRRGQRLSLQYHKAKKETMYVISGRMRLTLGDESEEVGEGKSVTIEPGRSHRVEALEDTRIVEVSTNHLDDVVRVEDDHGRAAGGRPLHHAISARLSRAYASFLRKVFGKG
jgi:mannose-6-phosphate isomerase